VLCGVVGGVGDGGVGESGVPVNGEFKFDLI
jgi:hypothetical protein